MAATITIRLVGAQTDGRDVRFSEFISQLEAIKTALKETEQFVHGQDRHVIDYKVIDMKHASPSEWSLSPLCHKGITPPMLTVF